MLVAAGVLPHPPVLVPQLAAGAAAELADLRRSCMTVVSELAASDPDVLVVVGGADAAASFEGGASGGFRGFGVDLSVSLPDGRDESAAPGALPMSLTVAAYLLSKFGWTSPTRGASVTFATSSSKASHVGELIAESAPRVALLAMGDGSAALTTKSPRYVIPGAVQWQAQATSALAVADLQRILALSEADADRFHVAGRAAWQVMAGAAAAAGPAAGWRGHIHADVSPYGVAYIAATWQL